MEKPFYRESSISSRRACCLSQRACRFRISLFWLRIRASLVFSNSSSVWQRFSNAVFWFWRFCINSRSIVGCGIFITSVLMELLYRKTAEKANPGKKRNRQNAMWIRPGEEKDRANKKGKTLVKWKIQWKTGDKRGCGKWDVDNNSKGRFIVQNRKINFSDLHKNIQLLARVWTVTENEKTFL